MINFLFREQQPLTTMIEHLSLNGASGTRGSLRRNTPYGHPNRDIDQLLHWASRAQALKAVA
jgi:hypothetical protein